MLKPLVDRTQKQRLVDAWSKGEIVLTRRDMEVARLRIKRQLIKQKKAQEKQGK